jgi:glycosyltransferase involved in cell wall biosynthesis
MQELVTIVTPSYNQGHFIRATIESVLNQDYPNVEYIIMDGGSTDETSSVVKDYASRLKFISERDRGQSDAINKGFRMAKGSILAWLNSDDLYLPGAIRNGVAGFSQSPRPGAVYGEGYLIDRAGDVTGRFPHTIPLNLWRLNYVSDYILQQSSFFRKDVLDDVGYLDENLHYAMDWELYIRIARRYPLGYVPEFIGCLREYAEAKSSAGGMRRVREIRDMLRRVTERRIPPGYIIYGLGTYHEIWCERIRNARFLKPVSPKLQALVKIGAGLLISHADRHSQGLYADGWASRLLRYMLHPGSGRLLIEGALPDWRTLSGQTLKITANGTDVGVYAIAAGDFSLVIDLPSALRSGYLDLQIRASRSIMPGRFTLRGDRRRLAYVLRAIRWSSEPQPSITSERAIAAGL